MGVAPRVAPRGTDNNRLYMTTNIRSSDATYKFDYYKAGSSNFMDNDTKLKIELDYLYII